MGQLSAVPPGGWGAGHAAPQPWDNSLTCDGDATLWCSVVCSLRVGAKHDGAASGADVVVFTVVFDGCTAWEGGQLEH